mgnify:CR=1 FL=1
MHDFLARKYITLLLAIGVSGELMNTPHPELLVRSKFGAFVSVPGKFDSSVYFSYMGWPR